PNVDLFVRVCHSLRRETIHHAVADRRAVKSIDAVNEEREVLWVVAEVAIHAFADDLRQSAHPTTEHRRASGQRLDHHQAKRLRPDAGDEAGEAFADELAALFGAQLAQEL